MKGVKMHFSSLSIFGVILIYFMSTTSAQENIHHNLPDNLEIIDPKSLGLSGTDLENFLGNVKLLPVEGDFGPKTQILTVGFDGNEKLNLQDFEQLSTDGLGTGDKEVAQMAFKKFKDFFQNPNDAKNFDDAAQLQATTVLPTTTPQVETQTKPVQKQRKKIVRLHKPANRQNVQQQQPQQQQFYSSTYRTEEGAGNIGTTPAPPLYRPEHLQDYARVIQEIQNMSPNVPSRVGGHMVNNIGATGRFGDKTQNQQHQTQGQNFQVHYQIPNGNTNSQKQFPQIQKSPQHITLQAKQQQPGNRFPIIQPSSQPVLQNTQTQRQQQQQNYQPTQPNQQTNQHQPTQQTNLIAQSNQNFAHPTNNINNQPRQESKSFGPQQFKQANQPQQQKQPKEQFDHTQPPRQQKFVQSHQKQHQYNFAQPQQNQQYNAQPQVQQQQNYAQPQQQRHPNLLTQQPKYVQIQQPRNNIQQQQPTGFSQNSASQPQPQTHQKPVKPKTGQNFHKQIPKPHQNEFNKLSQQQNNFVQQPQHQNNFVQHPQQQNNFAQQQNNFVQQPQQQNHFVHQPPQQSHFVQPHKQDQDSTPPPHNKQQNNFQQPSAPPLQQQQNIPNNQPTSHNNLNQYSFQQSNSFHQTQTQQQPQNHQHNYANSQGQQHKFLNAQSHQQVHETKSTVNHNHQQIQTQAYPQTAPQQSQAQINNNQNQFQHQNQAQTKPNVPTVQHFSSPEGRTNPHQNQFPKFPQPQDQQQTHFRFPPSPPVLNNNQHHQQQQYSTLPQPQHQILQRHPIPQNHGNSGRFPSVQYASQASILQPTIHPYPPTSYQILSTTTKTAILTTTTPRTELLSGVYQVTPSVPLIPLATHENAMNAYHSKIQRDKTYRENGIYPSFQQQEESSSGTVLKFPAEDQTTIPPPPRQPIFDFQEPVHHYSSNPPSRLPPTSSSEDIGGMVPPAPLFMRPPPPPTSFQRFKMALSPWSKGPSGPPSQSMIVNTNTYHEQQSLPGGQHHHHPQPAPNPPFSHNDLHPEATQYSKFLGYNVQSIKSAPLIGSFVL